MSSRVQSVAVCVCTAGLAATLVAQSQSQAQAPAPPQGPAARPVAPAWAAVGLDGEPEKGLADNQMD